MVPTFSPEEGMIDPTSFLMKISQCEFPVITNNKRITYFNIPAAFDIETSSFYENGEKRATMYIWQFGILNWVTYGRTWKELKCFLKVLSTILGLSEDCRLMVYIHNMAYEFQFIRKHFKWDDVFFMDDRKPIYGITGGFEFRCSLKLANKKLALVSDDLLKYKVEKAVGDLDYSKVRHSGTPLTEKEMGYCEKDIRVILAYIQEKIEQDGDITRIPLTNTGYVRNYCRKKCFASYKRYRRLMSELTLTSDEYSQLKRAFAGGFTHANAWYVDKKLTHVGSFDFTSSYPYVMLSERFPMSRSSIVESISSKEELFSLLNKYCCLFDITLHDLVPKAVCDFPLSLSKCVNTKGVVASNGRVVCAAELTTTVTEQDFWVLSAFYEIDYDTLEIHNFRIYEKGYLPKPLVLAIIKLYKDKTTLKGVEGEELNYLISKGMLNGVYGMSVTDIVRDVVKYLDDSFQSTKPDVNEAITKYNNSLKRFLFYPWGVWVTSYARANLFSGILECGDDYVYADTDSIKILNPESHFDYIERYNNLVLKKLQSAADFHGIDIAEFSPTTRKGVPKTIGVWDYEGIYDRFKTLGAKRYMVMKDGKYEITVAGLDKKESVKYLVKTFKDPLDGLTEHLVVPEDYSGRKILTYYDDEVKGVVVDYTGVAKKYHELSFIHMENSKYELTISDDFKNFLDFINGRKEFSW